MDLAVSLITNNNFKLTWTAPTDDIGVTGYVLSDGTLGRINATDVTIKNNSYSCIVYGASGHPYNFTLLAQDAVGNLSAPSNPVSFTTLSQPETILPTIPTNLAASAITDNSFTLTWTASTDNVGVYVYSITDSGSFFQTIDATNDTTMTYSVAGLAPNTTYNFKVEAFDPSFNHSGASTPLSVTTAADTTVPTIPINLVASVIADTSCLLNWTASSDDVALTGYVIYNGTTPLGTSTTTAFNATGLTPNTTYNLTVKAQDATGNLSPASSSLSVKTMAAGIFSALPAPTNLATSEVTMASITLSWTSSTSFGVTRYLIFNNGVYLGYVTGNYTNCSLSARPGTTYNLTIKALDAVGTLSAASAPCSVTTLSDTLPPTVPANLAVSAVTMTSFTLNWTASTDDIGVTSYVIYSGSMPLGTSPTNSYTAYGHAANTTYSITVKARDAAGNLSTASNPVSFATVADTTAPSAPLNLMTTDISATSVTLNWTASIDDVGVTSYVIYSGDTPLGTTTTNSFTATGLTPGTTYNLTVKAQDAAGNATTSSPLSITSLPILPYLADFEAAEGYGLGTLNNQLGWAVLSGTAQVGSVGAFRGTQNVVLNSGASAAEVDQEFGSSGSNPPIVFIDFYTKPVAGADPTTGTLFDLDSARVAFVLNGATGGLLALDGDGLGTGSWKTLTPAIALSADNLAADWQRLTVRLNYLAKTYDLYLNGQMIASDLKFRFSAVTSVSWFSVKGVTAASATLDDLYVGAANPLFADINGNGIDDVWETAHGLSLATDNRNADPDHDGLSNVQEYIAGSDPQNSSSGTILVLAAINGDNQSAPAGQFCAQPLIVQLRDAAGLPLANAPVAFTVVSGGGQLALTPTSTLTSSLSLITAANGTAQLYYLQPNTAGVQSIISVNAAATQVSFHMTSKAASNSTGSAKLAAGLNFSLLLDSSGMVWGSGLNSNGQLGTGPTVISNPVWFAGLYSISAVAAGGSHSLALQSDGTVWSWGNNANGQLGDGSTIQRPTPLQLPTLSGITAIAAGASHSLALRSDGTVWAWGLNSNGQLGDGTTTTPRLAPVQVLSLTGVIAIAAGDFHSLVLKSDGTVWAWGLNSNGQLGDGTTTSPRLAPVQVSGLAGVTAISAGSAHSLALKSVGLVYAWGLNANGQLGDGTLIQRPSPVPVSALLGVTAISAGASHSLALKSDGTLSAWGLNANGQLGDGTTIQRLTAVQVPSAKGPVAVAGGATHSLILYSDGTLAGFGSNLYGQFGNGAIDGKQLTPAPVSSGTGFVQVSSGTVHTLAVKNDQTLWAWGLNTNGQLGDGTTTARSQPVQIATLANVRQTAAGDAHSLALKTDGTVLAWGLNSNGQLGDSTNTQRLAPVQISTLSGITAVAAGSAFSLALKNDGTVWAWGLNSNGQLGDGTTTPRLAPVQISSLSGITAIAAGSAFSLALKNDGTVWAWGLNSNGQLGDSTTTQRLAPINITAVSGVTSISAGSTHSLALLSDGTVRAWGSNSNGQLGDGTTIQHTSPVVVQNLTNVTAITAGNSFSLALTADGLVYGWGLNSSGQLGDGGNVVQATAPGNPISGLSGVTILAAGSTQAFALNSAGTLQGWGGNASGQLGLPPQPSLSHFKPASAPPPAPHDPASLPTRVGPYFAIEIAPLSGSYYLAGGINNKGEISGTSVGPTGTSYFIWRNGVRQTFYLPKPTTNIDPWLLGPMNDRGQILIGGTERYFNGTYTDWYEFDQIYWNGALSEVSAAPGLNFPLMNNNGFVPTRAWAEKLPHQFGAQVLGVNNNNDAVGFDYNLQTAHQPQPQPKGKYWPHSGGDIPLPTAFPYYGYDGLFGSIAAYYNLYGYWGNWFSGSGYNDGYYGPYYDNWSSGVFGFYSDYFGGKLLNDSQQMVCSNEEYGVVPTALNVCVWDARTDSRTPLQDLPPPLGGSWATVPQMIDNRGNVIGFILSNNIYAPYNWTNVIWKNGVPQPLWDLIVNPSSLTVISDQVDLYPVQVNDQGQILCNESNHVTGGTGICLLTPMPLLFVDGNRDGQISVDGTDDTTADHPYRFWINDDFDGYGDFAPPDVNATPDCARDSVAGVNDLKDFFPVFLNIKSLVSALPPSSGATYKLKQADGALKFFYTSLTRATAFSYKQTLSYYADAKTYRITAEGTPILASYLNDIKDNDQGVLLMEGTIATTQPLVLVVEKDGVTIAEISLPLSIEENIVLLLHGMNSNTDTWRVFVNAIFPQTAHGLGYTDIADGAFQGSMPPLNASGVRCYRLQFGAYDLAKGGTGLEGITAANSPEYALTKCGDFESFDDLGQEVEDAINLILLRHPNAHIVLLGHSRGGLTARAFLQRPGTSPAKAAVVGLLTTGSPHQGSPMGRIYQWLGAHPRSVVANSTDWLVVDFLRANPNTPLDVRRPVIADLADNSVALAILNSASAVASLPSTIRYGELVYDSVPLGTLVYGIPIVGYYSVFDGTRIPIPNAVVPTLMADPRAFILGTSASGSANTVTTFHGDGIVPSASQLFTTLPGFTGTSIQPLSRPGGTVVHTDEPAQIFDLTSQLHLLIPSFTF